MMSSQDTINLSTQKGIEIEFISINVIKYFLLLTMHFN
jgi:hypothetical protein